MFLQIGPSTKPCDILCDAFAPPPCRMTASTFFVEGAKNVSQDNSSQVSLSLVTPRWALFSLWPDYNSYQSRLVPATFRV